MLSPRLSALLVGLVVLLFSLDAAAIPAFARRYETSCQTCHIAAPRLTPFGEAFLRNGYRFPAGAEEAAQKEEPVALGNEAQKELWPGSAVYPGQMPGKFPISLALDMQMAFGKYFEGAGHADGGHADAAPGAPAHADTKLRFDDMGGHARVLVGGALGNVASVFTAISFGLQGTVEVERAFAIFTPIDPAALHIKVGRFEPALHGVSLHRNLMGHSLRLTTTTAGLSRFAPEHALTGLQLSGVLFGHLGWYAGVVQNNVPVEEVAKDVYGRLETKVGGMRLDGVDQQAQSRAWRERSLVLGASVYRGRATTSFPTPGSVPVVLATRDDTFTRVGADAHVIMEDLLIDLVAARQQHSGSAAMPDVRQALDLAYAEVTYMTLPWLFPAVRFEASRVGSGDPKGSQWIGLLGINTVLRPNIILRAETAVGEGLQEHFGYRYSALSALFAL